VGVEDPSRAISDVRTYIFENAGELIEDVRTYIFRYENMQLVAAVEAI
jgi:hypothetical protein